MIVPLFLVALLGLAGAACGAWALLVMLWLRLEGRVAARRRRRRVAQAAHKAGLDAASVLEVDAALQKVDAELVRALSGTLAGLVTRGVVLCDLEVGAERTRLVFQDGTVLYLLSPSPLPELVELECYVDGGDVLLVSVGWAAGRPHLRFDAEGLVLEVDAHVLTG